MQGDTSPDSFFKLFETVGKYPKVLILGDYPSDIDLKNKKFLASKGGDFLRKVVKEIEPNYTLGYVPKIEKGVDLDIQLKPLRDFIKSEGFKVVVFYGQDPHKLLLPKEYWKGEGTLELTRKYPYNLDGVRYGAINNPRKLETDGLLKAPIYPEWRERIESLITGKINVVEIDCKVSLKKLDDLQSVLFEYMDEQRIGFDYEGTSLSPHSLEFDILGFSLATNKKATYVEFDRPITKPEAMMLSMFLSRKAKNLWTYNVSYEAKVTWSKISSKLVELQDAYTLCKIEGSTGRLKDNARFHLNASFWEDDVGSIVDTFETVFAIMTKAKKNSEEIFQLLKSGSYEAAREAVNADTKKFKAFLSIFVHLDAMIDQHGKPEQVEKGLTKYPKAWAAAPVDIMGKYCCYDSYYTVGLVDKLLPLHEHAYPYYISQSWAASAMESFGLNWNDTVAAAHEMYYISEAKECLFKLINLLDFTKVPVKDKKSGTVTITDLSDENRLSALGIYNNPNMSDADKLDALKDIFNPLSNLAESQQAFWSVYNTDFVTAITMFLSLEELLQSHPNVPDKAVELIDKTDLNKTISNLVSCDWATFAEIEDARKIRFAVRGIQEIVGSLNQKVKEKTGRFAGEIMEWQFQAHVKYGSLQVDEPDTWCDEFRILYYLRRFKKVLKSRSTYINGKVGRSNVWLSKIVDYASPPVRMRRYFDVQAEHNNNYVLKEDERWILDTSFNVNGANTRRWTAAIHVVPAASELREIYEARSKYSLLIKYDYSQAEIRLLAAMSGDENLLNAFKEGLDVHAFIASKIFNKPIESVSKSERKFSKGCSFAIIYGMSIEGFAIEYMAGSVVAAVKLFSDFYAQFPKVKIWMDARHKEAQASGFVTTIFGDKLKLDMTDPGGALRDAVNWPIQSSSSSIAAHCIWKNYESARALGIPVLPMVFTHDSHDMEFQAKNLFETIDNVLDTAIRYPLETFGTPMKIDWEVGVNQADSIEFKELSRNDNSRKYEFSCSRKAMNDVFPRLEQFFEVKHSITEETTKRESMDQLFQAKRAFSKYLGVDRHLVKGEIELTKLAA